MRIRNFPIALHFFPDTANFTDPAFTDSGDPLSSVNPADWSSEVGTDPGNGAGLETLPTGGASSNTPAQGSNSGASLLGWLNLANNVAQTATGIARSGNSTSRTGVNKPKSSLGSFGSVTTTTLIVIVLVFLGALWALGRK